jgi:PAS domain S-box-containing protein
MAETDVDGPATDAEVGELRARVARLEALVDELQVGVLVQGRSTEILVANAAALEMLGVDEADLIGATSFDPSWNAVHEDGSPFPGPDHPPAVALRTREPVRNVVVGIERPRTGDRVWLMVSASPVVRADGEVERVLTTFTDITERKRAESALRESEALNRSILDSIPGGIVHVSADGVVRKANREAHRILGLERSALVGLAAEQVEVQVVWEDGRPCLVEDYPALRCLETEKRQPPVTLGVRKPDGTIAWAVYSALPVFDPESHRVAGCVLTFVDITERKNLEEHLRHVQRVEAVGRLAGGVAHHFNNLLTVINGYASLLMKRISVGDPLHEDAAEIRKAGERAAQLTRQLLAFNRRHVPDRKVVDVNKVVSEMKPMLAPLFGELVRFDVDLRAEPATVWADPGQIEDIVLNLAVNARDAMPSGGSFTLATANQVVDAPDVRYPAMRPGPYVALVAADTGCGIASDVLDHIFEPFFTTKDVDQGTGLGLSTVHEIVTQNGGRVEVHSAVGRGSRFAVLLPSVEIAAAAEPAAPVRDVRRGRETILVVEDDEAVRTFLAETLRQSGYRVLEAPDGRAAVDLSARYPGSISLLLSDVIMPEMGGPEVARTLVASRPKMRVLFLTGYSGYGDPRAEVSHGAVDVLEKPVTFDELVAKVRELLDVKT